MRVVFLTHYYPPEIGAAQARIERLTHGLARSGIDVVVHTGFPNYPNGRVAAPYRNQPWLLEAGRVPVLRTAVFPAPNRGLAPRLVNHTAFSIGAVLGARLTGPADAVVVESPPLFTAAAGVLYSRLKRAALVMNVADRWPATAVELGALDNRVAIAQAERLERWCYRHAAAVTTPTHGIAASLEIVPEATGKVSWIPPAVDLERFAAVPLPALDGPLRVVYAGTVGLAQNLATLVEAARIAGPEVVEVTIAGDGAQAETVARQAASAPNVTWLGTVSPDAVPGLYSVAHAGAVLLGAQPILEGAFPTKLLEVMAAGRVVVLGARGEAAREVLEAGAGIVVPPDDPDALAGALRRLHDEPGRLAVLGAAGRRRVQERYTRARSVEMWRSVLDQLT